MKKTKNCSDQQCSGSVCSCSNLVLQTGLLRKLSAGWHSGFSSFAKPSPRLYGLAVDSFNIERNKVGRNQNLGQILQNYSLPQRALTQFLMYAGNVFDVRKIRGGNPYTVFLSKDSLYRLQYLVYEHSPVDYVVFDFTDSVKVSVNQKEILTRQKRVDGEISTSLWDAITKNNINPLVALQLSDIYAWTIDFFGLQPGDHFTVVYDEHYVDSVSIGLGQYPCSQLLSCRQGIACHSLYAE